MTLLGKETKYETNYNPGILDRVANPEHKFNSFVKLNCVEFTSVCPVTSQPDFGSMYISYIPDKWLVESKSLKLYLFSFRNHGAFHEACVQMIANDLIKLLDPNYLEVWGKFLPRGGISIDPYINYGKSETHWEMFSSHRLAMHDLNPELLNNR